jgi:predicted GIY-YIG superfamily endonuclease
MDYKNGKIYALRSHQTDKYVIGSTTQKLFKRLYAHKHSKEQNEVMKYSDVYIELIENYPCKNKEELTRRENEVKREKGIFTKIQKTQEELKELDLGSLKAEPTNEPFKLNNGVWICLMTV